MHLILLLSHFGPWPYVILFLGMLFEGTLFLLTASFLIAEHGLDPWLAVPILVIGSFLEELMWYEIGRRLSNWPKVAGWIDKVAKRFDPHIQNKTFRILAASKYIYGVHRPIVARSGMLNMPLKKFIPASFLSNLIWLVIIGFLGFAFSASFDVLKQYIKYAEIIPLTLLIIMFFLEKYFSSGLKKEL